MKVLFLTNIPSPYRMDFFNMWGEKCDLTVVFERENSAERGTYWDDYKVNNFKAVFLKGIDTRKDQAFSWKIIEVIKAEKYDWIIVTNTSSLTGMLAILYMKTRNIFFSIEGDGAYIPKREFFVKKWIKKKLISSATSWLSTCENHDIYYLYYGAKQDAVYRYPFSSVKSNCVLEYVPDVEEKQLLRRKLGVVESKVVLYVGRFISLKRLDVLLEAVRDMNDDLGVYLIGGSSEELVKEYKREIPSNVHAIPFVTQKDKLKEYYRMADVLCFPTENDVWGLVVNEAISCGLPVITTQKCNSGLTLLEQQWVVNVNDYSMLKEKITKILSMEEVEYKKMCEELLTRARKYTIEQMVERHCAIGKLLVEVDDN